MRCMLYDGITSPPLLRACCSYHTLPACLVVRAECVHFRVIAESLSHRPAQLTHLSRMGIDLHEVLDVHVLSSRRADALEVQTTKDEVTVRADAGGQLRGAQTDVLVRGQQHVVAVEQLQLHVLEAQKGA